MGECRNNKRSEARRPDENKRDENEQRIKKRQSVTSYVRPEGVASVERPVYRITANLKTIPVILGANNKAIRKLYAVCLRNILVKKAQLDGNVSGTNQLTCANLETTN